MYYALPRIVVLKNFNYDFMAELTVSIEISDFPFCNQSLYHYSLKLNNYYGAPSAFTWEHR